MYQLNYRILKGLNKPIKLVFVIKRHAYAVLPRSSNITRDARDGSWYF
jgi:hypothetical protein